LFFEPKVLYRAAVDDDVPVGDYMLPLGKAEIVQEGSDVTIVCWGTQVKRSLEASQLAEDKHISCEVIDLQTIVPWDLETVMASVKKTGRLIVTHEATYTGGFGGEIISEIQNRCFYNLKAPVERVTGFDSPFPLAWEEFYIPNKYRLLEAIIKVASE
jgi:2-oxoisovalerate dehydrogenase E1 component beta subunit